jgi:2-oxoglutarate dehydrogenase E1 component
VNKADVKTLVFCTGKFYELTEKEKINVSDCKIEQLFPLPIAQLKKS